MCSFTNSFTNLSSINPDSKVICRLVEQDFAKLGEQIFNKTPV